MENNRKTPLTKFQKWIVAAILLSAFTGIVIGYMRKKGIDSTAILYIGMPTMIALIFSTVPASRSVVGSTLKAITFIILISGPILQEGFICMLMAAPIFYIVGALAAWPFDHYRKKEMNGDNPSKLNVVVIPTLLLLMSMEGVSDYTTFSRDNVIEYSQDVAVNINELKNRLGSSRNVPVPDSLFAKIFPRPDTIHAQGNRVGDRHWVDVSYFKWVFWNEKRGTTQFEVIENTGNTIRFEPRLDSNYMSSYLQWGVVVVNFTRIDQASTRVSWKINFTRKLDPAWYVQPLQRYAVAVLAETMVKSLL